VGLAAARLGESATGHVVLNDAFVSVDNLRVGSLRRFVRPPSDVLGAASR
jgi:hypothetical protein